MSIDLGIPVGPQRRRLSDPSGPETAGWASAATAARALLRIDTPMVLWLDVAGHGRLVIDFSRREYVWDTPLDEFPVEPLQVLVSTRALRPGSAPLIVRGQNLDPLLWLIGINAYGERPASWLRSGERYRLARWPRLTELDLSLGELQVCASLGNHDATADELAEATALPQGEVQRVLNALSLIGALDASRDLGPALRPRAAHATVAPTGGAAEDQGASTALRRRLRGKLGS